MTDWWVELIKGGPRTIDADEILYGPDWLIFVRDGVRVAFIPRSNLMSVSEGVTDSQSLKS
jgi:hypothetical protein